MELTKQELKTVANALNYVYNVKLERLKQNKGIMSSNEQKELLKTAENYRLIADKIETKLLMMIEQPSGVVEQPSHVTEPPSHVAEQPTGAAEQPTGAAEPPSGVVERVTNPQEQPNDPYPYGKPLEFVFEVNDNKCIDNIKQVEGKL